MFCLERCQTGRGGTEKSQNTRVARNALAMNAMEFPREGRFFLFFWSLSPRELQVSSRYRQRERWSSLFVLN